MSFLCCKMGEKNLTAERENDFIMGCQKGNCATPGVNQKRSVRGEMAHQTVCQSENDTLGRCQVQVYSP